MMSSRIAGRIPRVGTAMVVAVATVAALATRLTAPVVALEPISFVGSTSNSGLAINSLQLSTPAGIKTGDLMLAVVLVRGNPTVTEPAGWTFLRRDGRSHLYYRIVSPGESSSATWTFSERHNAGGSIVAYRGVDSSGPIDASNGEKGNGPSTEITAPSATSNVDDTQVVAFYGIGIDTTISPPAGYSERVDQQTGGTRQISWEVSDDYQSKAGATGDQVATAAAEASNSGQLVVLTPAQPAPPVYRAFSSISYWNTPLPADAPIDRNSANIINYMVQDSSTNYVKFSGVSDTGEWGMPIYWAEASDPTYNVESSCSTKAPPEFATMRIPLGAKPDPTSDAAMVVFDVGKGLVYSMWQTVYDGSKGKWSSCGGGVYYLSSNGLDGSLAQSDQDSNTGHRGVPGAEFAVRYDEVQAGEIDHVLKIAVNNTKCEHYFPMVRDECGTTDQYAPPEGTRIRLKLSIDLSKYGLSPAALTIATALQKYGAVIGDQSGGPVNLKVENTVAEGEGQLWSGQLSKDDLSAFTLDDFEVIELGYGQ